MRPFAESFISHCRCCPPLFCGGNRCIVSADTITFCLATCISWRRGDHRGWRGLLRSPARPRTLLLVPNRATAVKTHTHTFSLSVSLTHTHTCSEKEPIAPPSYMLLIRRPVPKPARALSLPRMPARIRLLMMCGTDDDL